MPRRPTHHGSAWTKTDDKKRFARCHLPAALNSEVAAQTQPTLIAQPLGSSMTLYTIGYEGLTLEIFLALLTTNGIEHLVDIREAPISRKPGFAKSALSTAVEAAGIRYLHVRALGCPKPIRDRLKADRDWGRYTRGFKRYLGGQSQALDALRDIARGARACVMCYETDFNRCHRTFVAEAVVGASEDIHHIAADTSGQQARLPLT